MIGGHMGDPCYSVVCGPYAVMRSILLCLLAVATAAPALGQERWRETFQKVAHLLPPGEEVATASMESPPERPRLPAVIKQEDPVVRGAVADDPPEPPRRQPLVFVKDMDGDGVEEIVTVTTAVEGGETLYRATVFTRGKSEWWTTFSAQMGKHRFLIYFSGRGRRVFIGNRDSPALCLDLSRVPADVFMMDTGPYKILHGRIGWPFWLVPAGDDVEVPKAAGDLKYDTYEERKGALRLAEALHARGKSEIAKGICRRVADSTDYPPDADMACALLADIHMDLGMEDEAMRYYQKAARGASPRYKHKLISEYYRNRGFPDKEKSQLEQGAADMARFSQRLWRIHVAVLAGSLVVLAACVLLLWRWRLALGARAVFAVLAAAMMLVYVYVLSPPYYEGLVAAVKVYWRGVYVLLLANGASAVLVGRAMVTSLVRKESLRWIPLEALLAIVGLGTVGGAVVFIVGHMLSGS